MDLYWVAAWLLLWCSSPGLEDLLSLVPQIFTWLLRILSLLGTKILNTCTRNSSVLEHTTTGHMAHGMPQDQDTKVWIRRYNIISSHGLYQVTLHALSIYQAGVLSPHHTHNFPHIFTQIIYTSTGIIIIQGIKVELIIKLIFKTILFIH